MKKLVSILLALVTVVCLTFAFSGCGDENDEKENEEKWYVTNLDSAYYKGLIDSYALESIACSYFDWRKFESNPYKDKFISTEELSEDNENKIKRTFMEERSSDNLEKVKILNYYGKYDNNFVATLGFGEVDFKNIDGADVTVGGVAFPDFDREKIQIWVFHCPDKAPDERAKGTLFNLENAYDNGLIEEDGLKSIACCLYERNEDFENPYKGLYKKPAQGLCYETKCELRKAYLQQFGGVSRFDEITVFAYFGTYNGNLVVGIDGGECYFPDGSDSDIGGVTFYKNSADGIYVYKAD